jgi:hypothetical protein
MEVGARQNGRQSIECCTVSYRWVNGGNIDAIDGYDAIAVKWGFDDGSAGSDLEGDSFYD